MVPGRITFAECRRLCFQGDRLQQRNQRRFRGAVSANLWARTFGGAAADGDDAPSSDFAPFQESPRALYGMRCSNSRRTYAARWHRRCPATVCPPVNPPTRWAQNVDSSAARDYAADGLFRCVEAIQRGRKRYEIRIIEVRLLDSRREADDCEPASSKAFVTCVPRPPLAPVTRAVFLVIGVFTQSFIARTRLVHRSERTRLL